MLCSIPLSLSLSSLDFYTASDFEGVNNVDGNVRGPRLTVGGVSMVLWMAAARPSFIMQVRPWNSCWESIGNKPSIFHFCLRPPQRFRRLVFTVAEGCRGPPDSPFSDPYISVWDPKKTESNIYVVAYVDIKRICWGGWGGIIEMSPDIPKSMKSMLGDPKLTPGADSHPHPHSHPHTQPETFQMSQKEGTRKCISCRKSGDFCCVRRLKICLMKLHSCT